MISEIRIFNNPYPQPYTAIKSACPAFVRKKANGAYPCDTLYFCLQKLKQLYASKTGLIKSGTIINFFFQAIRTLIFLGSPFWGSCHRRRLRGAYICMFFIFPLRPLCVRPPLPKEEARDDHLTIHIFRIPFSKRIKIRIGFSRSGSLFILFPL